MKIYVAFIFVMTILIISCNSKHDKTESNLQPGNEETLMAEADKQLSKESIPVSGTYSNQRFRDVVIETIGIDSFLISGKGQIFEANFNWVLEDGHEELQSGFQTTEAGAPEWGKFKFLIHAPKKRKNSTLTLILYESSAMDGSRQHELPITLN